MTETLLNVHDVAEMLNVKVPYVRRLVRERRITHHKVGHFIRFKREDVERFIEDGARQAVA